MQTQRRAWISSCALLAVVVGLIAWAAQRAGRAEARYRPQSDTEVIYAPSRLGSELAAHTSVSGLRAAARALLPAEALSRARSHIEAAQESGDLRPLGRAEALLEPLLGPTPNAEALLLRATIAQARHRFGAALVDLDRALQLDAGAAQVHLTRAFVLLVLGRYAAARAACAALRPLVNPFVAGVCEASVNAPTQDLDPSGRPWQGLLRQASSVSERGWVLSLWCEQSFWSGATDAAERICREAVALQPRDRYTRALYADVLLEQGDAARAYALTSGHEEDDALLLRRALAAQALHSAEQSRLVELLQARFQQSRARGDRIHQREQARLLLALGAQPKRALALALEGFSAQREPWDVRVVLEAARAAGEPAAAAPALAFMREQTVRSTVLWRLARDVGGAP